jgi:hypothetical protein
VKVSFHKAVRYSLLATSLCAACAQEPETVTTLAASAESAQKAPPQLDVPASARLSAPEREPSVALAKLAYVRRNVPNARVSLFLPKLGEHSENGSSAGGMLLTTLVLGGELRDRLTVTVTVAHGLDALSGLESDRADGCHFSRSHPSICGRRAERLLVACPERDILCAEGVEFPDGRSTFGGPEYIPPMTKWVLAFNTASVPGSVSIEAPTAFARALTPIVERVLGSISCE